MALTFDASMLELDEGLLADVILQMETVEDTLEKAIAKYDYPYADGADLEDMGQKAHTVKIRCYFWDDADQQSYDTHTLLLDSLEDKELLDFVHPKYGLMQGKIESIVIQHDDSIRKATIDLTFVEQMRKSLQVLLAESVQAATEDAYVAGQRQQESLLAAAIRTAFPADAGAILKTLDTATGLLAQVQEYSNAMRTFVGQVEGYIAAAEAIVNQVVSPINSLLATITYTANLPGRILGNITRVLEKVALLHTSLQNFPSRFLSSLDDSFQGMETSFQKLGAADTAATAQKVSLQTTSNTFTMVDTAAAGLDNTFQKMQTAFQNICSADTSEAGLAARELMTTHLQIACAQRLALEAASIYAADDTAARDTSKTNSGGTVYANATQAAEESDGDAAKTTTLQGNRLAHPSLRLPPALQVMNIRELEETLAVVRTRIETAVESAREIDSLKTMAVALLSHVNHVRLEREKMMTVTLDNPMPLHLVCLKYGLPYRDAERLIKVNNIRQPNFTGGEVAVYVR